MNPNDYDFWSVGNEQLSLQNHFPKHIPSIHFLTHSGADSPSDANSANNNYTCAEPEILRKSLESALQCAHDEIEKYQLTLNENTAKKLLEATAQGAFRDDPNIRNVQNRAHRPKEYKPSKLRLMELFVPPIREEDDNGSGSGTFKEGQSHNNNNKNIEKIHTVTTSPSKMLKSPSVNREKRNSTPSILSSSMFQPPTPNEQKKSPFFDENSQKPPIVPLKIDKTSTDDVLTKEEIDKIISTSPKGKSQSFSFLSGGNSFTENEQSVTTIKSSINDELLQLLNKYYPSKNKSQYDEDELNTTEISTEQELRKSEENMKTSKGSMVSDEVDGDNEGKENDNISSESSSDSEIENILEDSFLPSRIQKPPIKPSGSGQSSTDDINAKPSTEAGATVPNKLSKTEDNQISDTSISAASSNSIKLKKRKNKKNIVKDIFSPIHRIFKNDSSKSSPRKMKSNENINRDGSISESTDSNEDESKYTCEEVLGKGANAVVKLAKSSYTGNIKNLDNEKYYAIKQFRKRRKNEPYKAYIKKVISEFCISSSLKHQNVVETVDLIQDKNENWCEVMEYCSGGDLYTRINTGTLTNKDEINCYFKQLLTGVAYLHSVGVCHRDLKPENLLMDETGTILKITDFGVSEVFRFPWEKNVVKRVTGLCGSEPYIAPEEWSEDKDYDPIKVDIWACAIVFYTMNHMSVPWRQANPGDKYYDYYLNHITRFGPIEELPEITHEVLYHMLDPNPETRWSMDKIIESDWIQGITACGGEAYKGKGKAISGDGHAHTSKWKV